MRRIALCLALCAAPLASAAPGADDRKPTTLKGVVYRGDREHPAAGALVVLLDQKKSGEKDNSVHAKTDARGHYAFERVAGGKYLVSIRSGYRTKEEVPCKLLMAKTKDKDSALLVVREGDIYVEQIFIKNFSVKSGSGNVKDFDIACEGLFGK